MPPDEPLPPRPSAPSSARVEAWSEYWASGALHSCAGSFTGNYAGELRRFWEAVFAGLPCEARVLDLCCGNAPLSRLLLEGSSNAQVGAIEAVDAARIAPGWANTLAPADRARLHLHPGVDACALPFADAYFDLCMSQYGIEYAGLAAMAEVARVLRPGASFAAVLHHHDALPVRIARDEVAHLAWLEAPAGLLERAEAMIEPIARSATPAGQAALRSDARANAERAAFNAGLQSVDARLQATAHGDVLQEARDALMAVLQQARNGGAPAGHAALARLRRDLQADALRQRELIECALDEAGVRALLAPLHDAAPVCRPLEFERGGIAGWAVTARRG